MIAVHSAWIGICCPTRRVGPRANGRPTSQLPDRALLGAAQRIGLAAREHGRHAGPEELGAERRDEGGNADLGDEDAVEEADEQRRTRAPPTTASQPSSYSLNSTAKTKPEKAMIDGKAEVDLAGADDEGQARWPAGSAAAASRGRSCRCTGARNTCGAVYMNRPSSSAKTTMIGSPSSAGEIDVGLGHRAISALVLQLDQIFGQLGHRSCPWARSRRRSRRGRARPAGRRPRGHGRGCARCRRRRGRWP